MTHSPLLQRLLAFLDGAPTPYHAVQCMQQALQQQGYQPLTFSQTWNLQPGGRYLLTRNDSALIAWQMPRQGSLADSGLRMVGTHTDSPCLKVKPNPELHQHGYNQLGVEVYGGVLLAPWFDRDLSLAGRVSYLDEQGQLSHQLIDFAQPIAIIPSLAIHLDREANNGRAINAQTFLPPIVGQSDQKADVRQLLHQQLVASGCTVREVLAYDLSFYDSQPAALVGLEQHFVASARLDNLLSCFVGLEALLHSGSEQGMLLVCNDHEEVGSMSTSGAQGPLLRDVLSRLLPDVEQYQRMLAGSMLISADNAHGIHPNFADKHDANHGPLLNHGPVIKINANQRYASNDITSALISLLANQQQVPLQRFVVRQDMACGSTIGPITAAEIGVKTLDLGLPQLAMHSIRELCGAQDVAYGVQLLQAFFAHTQLPHD